ncbi:MAG: hypothetical protein ACE5OR_08435 [bacterium]
MDNESKKIGINKDEITVEDYTSLNLMISDLQLAEYISPTTEEGKFVKKGLPVIPHPVRRYDTSQPVYIYFEIYNLTRDDYGRTHFRTDYTVSSLKGKKNVVSKVVAELGQMVGIDRKKGKITVSYEDRGTSDTEIGYTGIDMKDPLPGDYQLTVTVGFEQQGEGEKECCFHLVRVNRADAKFSRGSHRPHGVPLSCACSDCGVVTLLDLEHFCWAGIT